MVLVPSGGQRTAGVCNVPHKKEFKVKKGRGLVENLEEMKLICQNIILLIGRLEKDKREDSNLPELIRDRFRRGFKLSQRHFDDLAEAENIAAMERVLSSDAVPSAKGLVTLRLKIDEEREVLDLIKKLRERGATYREVAESLNEDSIPTFSAKGRWHAQTIHRLCPEEFKGRRR